MELILNTTKKEEIIDITKNIRDIIEKNFNEEASACLIYTPHTTCAILIQENYDADVQFDLLNHLKETIPLNKNWKHSEGNSDAHIKSALIGVSKTIPTEKKELKIGRWQGIGLAEFDGPRKRKVIIKQLK